VSFLLNLARDGPRGRFSWFDGTGGQAPLAVLGALHEQATLVVPDHGGDGGDEEQVGTCPGAQGPIVR
jgi:hypothetical protein